jgi:hypothetical protein
MMKIRVSLDGRTDTAIIPDEAVKDVVFFIATMDWHNSLSITACQELPITAEMFLDRVQNHAKRK